MNNKDREEGEEELNTKRGERGSRAGQFQKSTY